MSSNAMMAHWPRLLQFATIKCARTPIYSLASNTKRRVFSQASIHSERCASRIPPSCRGVSRTSTASIHAGAPVQQQQIEDEPVSYTRSKAASWDANQSYGPPPRDAPWYEPVVVGLTLVTLIVYCFVREDNQLDDEMTVNLFTRFTEMEAQVLEKEIKDKKLKGLCTEDEEKSLSILQNKIEMDKALEIKREN